MGSFFVTRDEDDAERCAQEFCRGVGAFRYELAVDKGKRQDVCPLLPQQLSDLFVVRKSLGLLSKAVAYDAKSCLGKGVEHG